MATAPGSCSQTWCARACSRLIELEVSAMLGAEYPKRPDGRLGYRNGSRPRIVTTQVGDDIPLLIHKLRSGRFFSTILEPSRRIDQALFAVIMEAWVKGISARKVDALVAAKAPPACPARR